MNKKKILLFVLFTFGICLLCALFVHLADIHYGTIESIIFIALIYLPAPALATVIVQKFIYRQPLIVFGFTLKNITIKKATGVYTISR
ncbi:MAG TPA: hypothetical protein VKI61_14335 [Chitinophagaceae bacterium]|jgi:uncharacterized protein|nr:hypothetical protein [Chitinophagaceae bacterium]